MEHTFLRIPYAQSTFEALPLSLQELVEKAKAASTDAYAPYSRFNVGAAALLGNGEIVTASNQESVSFPTGLCAERVLIFSVFNHYRNIPVKSIAVIAAKDGIIQNVSPCGICRQTLLDAEIRQKSPIEVLFFTGNRFIVFHSAKELMAFSFTEI